MKLIKMAGIIDKWNWLKVSTAKFFGIPYGLQFNNETEDLLIREAEDFINGGGHVTLTEWKDLEIAEQSALIIAHKVIEIKKKSAYYAQLVDDEINLKVDITTDCIINRLRKQEMQE
jgi:hypothetical protein